MSTSHVLRLRIAIICPLPCWPAPTTCFFGFGSDESFPPTHQPPATTRRSGERAMWIIRTDCADRRQTDVDAKLRTDDSRLGGNYKVKMAKLQNEFYKICLYRDPERIPPKACSHIVLVDDRRHHRQPHRTQTEHMTMMYC